MEHCVFSKDRLCVCVCELTTLYTHTHTRSLHWVQWGKPDIQLEHVRREKGSVHREEEEEYC